MGAHAGVSGCTLWCNLATFVWYPLVAGLFFHEAVHLAGLGPRAPAYYLVVFATFVVALAVNFFGVFAYRCYLDGSSLAEKARTQCIPILPAELFSALLTMAVAYVAVTAGMVGIVLAGLALLIFQYLVGELLKSKQRGEELQRIATTDELTGPGQPRAVPRRGSTSGSPPRGRARRRSA